MCFFGCVFDSSASRLDFLFFFFTDPATTEIYTLSLHDAFRSDCVQFSCRARRGRRQVVTHPVEQHDGGRVVFPTQPRSEEHTSELQSRGHLVCRLLLEKKKHNRMRSTQHYTDTQRPPKRYGSD